MLSGFKSIRRNEASRRRLQSTKLATPQFLNGRNHGQEGYPSLEVISEDREVHNRSVCDVPFALLTREQWKALDPPIPKPRTRSDGRGRPWKNRRAVINGILALRTVRLGRTFPTDAPGSRPVIGAFSTVGSLGRHDQDHDCSGLEVSC